MQGAKHPVNDILSGTIAIQHTLVWQSSYVIQSVKKKDKVIYIPQLIEYNNY